MLTACIKDASSLKQIAQCLDTCETMGASGWWNSQAPVLFC